MNDYNDDLEAQALLKDMKRDKAKIITKSSEFTHFQLNGADMVKLLPDTVTTSLMVAGIQNCIDYHAVTPDNIYSVQRLLKIHTKLEAYFIRHHRSTWKESVPELARVMALVSDLGSKIEASRNARIESGVVNFEDLEFLFKEDDRLAWFNSEDIRVGGRFKRVEYKNGWSGSYAIVVSECFVKIGPDIARSETAISIPEFGGTIEIDKLPVREIVEGSAVEIELTKRGRVFVASSSVSSAYLEYVGDIVQPSYWSEKRYRADGRVIVDPAQMSRVESGIYNDAKRLITGSRRYDDDETESVSQIEIPENNLFACSPYVMGFSFRAKTWGVMRVDGLKPIQWAENAFDRLVLEDKTKKRVRALVRNSGSAFTDIIGGKGGGCVFLLHGEPGQGKTLTAETVAEDLKRPLYSISVGELGTDPDQLEERLRDILDLATVWDAVLLLDEADIFLEARDEKDVLRNAMVGVFLRLLEYHQGVLFLTTNRVRNIDRAFYSRISVAIAFGSADKAKRANIWSNILAAAGIDLTDDEVRQLIDFNLNGRQIKNIVRTAGTLAKEDGATVDVVRLIDEIKEATSFEREMLNAPDVLSKSRPALSEARLAA